MNSDSRPQSEGIPGLPAIATLVLWVVCDGIGIAGLRLHYPRPTPSPAPGIQTQLVKVELPRQAVAPPPETPPPEPAPSTPLVTAPIPPAPPPLAVPDAPAVTPVASPSAAVAFAVPVEGLTHIVDVSQAAHAGFGGAIATTGTGQGRGPASSPAPATRPLPQVAAPPAVTRLTYGQGEGRQPLPDYPREAIAARQQGTVTVRFSVDEAGRVTSSQIASGGGTRWPLLNQSALRAVRDTWHFAPGPSRLFEVSIQFELPQ